MVVFPDIIIKILFGQDYMGAAPALMLLALGAVFINIANVNFSVFTGIGKPKISTKIVLIAAGFNIITNAIFIPMYGFVGAAITTLASYILMAFLSLVEIRKYLDVALPLKKWLLNIILVVFIVFLIIGLKSWLSMNIYLEALIILAIAGIIYSGLAVLFRLADISEIKKLVKIALGKNG